MIPTTTNYVIILGILILVSLIVAYVAVLITDYLTYRKKNKHNNALKRCRMKKAQQTYRKMLLHNGFQRQCRYQQAVRNYLVRAYE